jgi:hypothetical protein
VWEAHPVQILAMFRLLGLDQEKGWFACNKIRKSVSTQAKEYIGLNKPKEVLTQNHLIQMRTGEGII